jgi:hypothetical protein
MLFMPRPHPPRFGSNLHPSVPGRFLPRHVLCRKTLEIKILRQDARARADWLVDGFVAPGILSRSQRLPITRPDLFFFFERGEYIKKKKNAEFS